MTSRSRHGDEIAPLFTWRTAICQSDLKPTQRHVAITLSLYMSELGNSAFPGASRLAEDTGLSVRSIRSALGELVELGWLKLITRGGLRGEKRVANHYEARIPPTPLPLHDVHPCTTFTRERDDRDPCSSRPRPLQDVHPNSPRTLQELKGGHDSASQAQRPATASRSAVLVEHYRSVYRQTHSDQPPPAQWLKIAARKIREAILDGRTDDVIEAALNALVNDEKRPTNLDLVIGDYLRHQTNGAA